MGRRIELPKKPSGKPEEQLNALYSYLYQMAEALNSNLEEIGGNDLTDSEMMIVRDITGGGDVSNGWEEMETLKSLIIKTAKFVKNESDMYRTKLLGDYVAEGKFGKYVRHTGLDVDVTPTGITQNYTFEEIVQGLKTYEVNAKNYIKTGLLRTVNNVPVYGVAIGKDVVTFSNDGTETYNDGNKVAELTADELSFWQSGNKIASYTGSEISFYQNNTEVMYIQNGKIGATKDIELSAGKKVKIGYWTFGDDGMTYRNGNDGMSFEIAKIADADDDSVGVFYNYYEGTGGSKIGRVTIKTGYLADNNEVRHGIFYFQAQKSSNNTEHKYFLPSVSGTVVFNSHIGSLASRFTDVNAVTYYGDYVGTSNYPITDVYATTLHGTLARKTTNQTNMNNITESGTYIIGFSSMTNKPSDIVSGSFPLEVLYYTTGYVFQRITTADSIYIREMRNSTWGSWYKFTGTAV